MIGLYHWSGSISREKGPFLRLTGLNIRNLKNDHIMIITPPLITAMPLSTLSAFFSLYGKKSCKTYPWKLPSKLTTDINFPVLSQTMRTPVSFSNRLALKTTSDVMINSNDRGKST